MNNKRISRIYPNGFKDEADLYRTNIETGLQSSAPSKFHRDSKSMKQIVQN